MTNSTRNNNPARMELLAPAGGMNQLRAALRFGLFDRDPGELLEDESALLTEDDVFRLIAGKGLDRDAAAAETRKIARGGYDPERHDAFFEDRSPEGRGIRYLWTRAECVSHLYEQALIYGGSDGKQALQ